MDIHTGMGTGRAIAKGMGPAMKDIVNMGLGAEIIYSFIIIACSLMVYSGTKELYELTKHKGIKYFRLSFLFFAIAYFFRSFIKIILITMDMREIREIAHLFGSITIFLFVYLSSIAILYLLYSVIYKKWKKDKSYIIHIIAIILAITTIIFASPITYLTINALLLILIIIAIKSSHKKKNKLHTIYILLSVFWIINVLDILIPNFFQTFQLLIYLSSLGIFLTIVYKTLRSIGK